jgi:hypothetical protein
VRVGVGVRVRVGVSVRVGVRVGVGVAVRHVKAEQVALQQPASAPGPGSQVSPICRMPSLQTGHPA